MDPPGWPASSKAIFPPPPPNAGIGPGGRGTLHCHEYFVTLFIPFLGPACVRTTTWPPRLLCCLCQINSLFLHKIDMAAPTLCGCAVTWGKTLGVVPDTWRALPVFSLNRTGPFVRETWEPAWGRGQSGRLSSATSSPSGKTGPTF